MRYFGLIFVVALIIVILIAANIYLADRRKEPVRDLATASEIARQLDRVVTDPTLIGDRSWREQSNRLLDRWYKGR